MSEQTSSGGGKISGWLKTIIGTGAGLLSGAVMMYASPLIDKVIRPGKPVANFGVEYQGLNVTFHNRSTNASQGWWEFGDGSPLEPLVPNQEIVVHPYPGPGEYTAKLSIRNLIGDESERPVTVRIDNSNRQTDPLRIDTLDVVPISPGCYAPATFRVTSKIKNAQVCVWDVSDDRPIEINTEKPTDQERMVTFQKPGGYLIKLAAVNGNQHDEKSEIVNVLEAPTGTITAILSVTDQGMHVDTITTPYTFADAFPAAVTDSVHPINRLAPARAGYEITDIRIAQGGKQPVSLQGKTELVIDAAAIAARNARSLRLQLAPDRHSVRLTGELFKDGGLGKRGAAAPSLTVPILLVQEKRWPDARPAIPVTATLTVPGAVMLMLPSWPNDWTQPRRQMRLELRDGDLVVWQGASLPRGVTVTVQNRRCLLTATQVGEQVRLDLIEVRPGVNSASR